MQRYNLWSDDFGNQIVDRETNGEWVRADDAEARIRELEQEREAAYARGVQEGIARVIGNAAFDFAEDGTPVPDEEVQRACRYALAAFEQEQNDAEG